ncbi:MAG TPA: metallophosphoesterase family protein, partial [Vicinamibacterales bacterium]
MRLAIFSDIHGNLPALEAVLAHVHSQAFDALYCLGDLVGYGASPNEVVDRIRRDRIPTLVGNYDDGVGYDRE